MAFLDLVAELSGTLPGLSPLLAEKHINRAWQDIRNARLWSFLTTDAAILCPTQITTGTIAITQGALTVTASAAASAALLAAPTSPGLTNLQIRFGATSPAIGQVYNIRVVDQTNVNAIVLTLDRAVVEATNAASGYQCYRCYVTPPILDFRAWQSIVDMVNGTPMKVNYTSSAFDVKDPQRQAQGLAYYCGFYQSNQILSVPLGTVTPNVNVDAGTPIYELWPHPTSGQTFYARIRRAGLPFTLPTDQQPDVIPDQLILQRALYMYSYPFAKANVAHFSTFKGVNWNDLIVTARATYVDLYRDAARNDDEQALQSIWSRGHGLRAGAGGFKGLTDFPIDANFIQSHLLNI